MGFVITAAAAWFQFINNFSSKHLEIYKFQIQFKKHNYSLPHI